MEEPASNRFIDVDMQYATSRARVHFANGTTLKFSSCMSCSAKLEAGEASQADFPLRTGKDQCVLHQQGKLGASSMSLLE